MIIDITEDIYILIKQEESENGKIIIKAFNRVLNKEKFLMEVEKTGWGKITDVDKEKSFWNSPLLWQLFNKLLLEDLLKGL